MVVTVGQHYNNVGEMPTVKLYTRINRHAAWTPEKQQQTKTM